MEVISTGESDRTDDWEGIRVWRLAPRNLYWRFARERELPNRVIRAAWHAIDLWNPFVLRAVDRILEQIRPDVVNTHNIDGLSPAVWQAARRRAGAVVHTVHDYHLVCARATMRRADGAPCDRLCRTCNVYAGYHKLFRRNVRVLIAPSRAAAEMHRDCGWSVPAIEVVRNAVDAPPFVPHPVPHDEPLRVLFLSRLEREKGCETLLSVMRQCDGIRFHVAGRGPYEQRFRELAREAENVAWHGFVTGNDKHELLSAADVFLQLSECRENAPLGLIEAKRYGLYILGTEIGGIPEQIESVCEGRLIQPGGAEDLRGALEQLSRERQAIRDGRGERIRRNAGYGAREMVEEYVRVFRSALALPG